MREQQYLTIFGRFLSAFSEKLADLYREIITRDIDYSYRTNLEQHLWKQSFYKPIDGLRNYLEPSYGLVELVRAVITDLIDNVSAI